MNKPACENRIVLRALGGAWIELPGTPVRITARKQVAVIAYLALDRFSASRDLLAGLLWGDVPDAKARASLRQALSELRAAHPVLRDALRIDRANVILDPDRIEIDTVQLLDELKAGHLPAAIRSGSELVNDILYGFETMGSRFADWLADTRRQIAGGYLECITQAAARADLAPTLRMDMADAALGLDPLGENHCRFAMQLANDLGDIGRALQTYAAFYARMEAELDMEPSLLTQDLAAAIKMGATERSMTAPVPAPLAEPAPLQDAPPAAANPHSRHGRPVLAVLPLRAIGPQDLKDSLTEMLVDDVVMKIARQREISIISRVSVRHLASRPDVAAVLRDKMNVRYLLSGTIRLTDGGYHLNVELSRTDDGLLLWAHSLEVSEDDLFRANSDTAEQVVHMLVPQLHRSELSDIRVSDISNLSAYQKLLKAQELVYTLSAPQLDTAGHLLHDAVATWPGYVPARVALADWYSLRVGQGLSDTPAADMAALKNALEQALALDGRSGRAMAMLGHNIAIYERRYDEALVLFDDALRATPGDAETLLWTGPTLAYADHECDAVERLMQASRLTLDDPLRFRYDHFLSIAHFASGDMKEAARIGLASMARNSRYTSNLRITAGACVAIGDMDKARELATRIMLLEPRFRVSNFISRQAFRDPARRADFGDLLRQAGLPN
ncbi:BTAD domain-containing putative transcriptional regulator [uncultured Sulfitobacter sp.]|jgi:DNA-binding SARP family transcriptional activator/TolB-like protein|uniref:BTAD domain-containing putative transcriptional regulator n=1 Tax=Sulfitobacter sp. SH22 TaxID=3421172 RepID=UPI0025F0AA3A|nr:BTAD domain-containing putative transcriptional regulator [uncultured Sulfitobacter sp.]